MVSVRVELLDDRIAARSDHRFPGDTEMSKSIPGGRWSKNGRFWHYPKTLATCRILREVYTDMLVVGPELLRWSRSEASRSRQMAALAASDDTTLRRVGQVAPRLAEAMEQRKYQKVGARILADRPALLLADEPTLGKTIQYLGGLAEAGIEEGCHLIVSPKSSLKTTWADEIMKWTDWHPFWMPEGRSRRERFMQLFVEDEHPVKFLIVNPRMLEVKVNTHCSKCDAFALPRPADKLQRVGFQEFPDAHYVEQHNTKPRIQKCDWPFLFSIAWRSICVDEAHQSVLGNRSASKKTQAAEGLTRLKITKDGKRIASTGTPLKGRAINFWPTLNWLDPVGHASKWAWAESFLEMDTGVFGTTIGDIRPDREEALNEALRGIMLRRTKREVQPDLPKDVYINHWVDLEGKHKQQYEEMVLEGEIEITGGSLSTRGILAEYTGQKKFAFGAWQYSPEVDALVPDPQSSPKLDKLLTLLEQRGVTGDPKRDFKLEGGFKYIIGSQYNQILDFLENHFEGLGIRCGKITGAVSGNKRTKQVDSFQNDPDGPRVLFINTLAGGTSLTLDYMCDEMFILDETWVNDEQFQLEGRIRNRSVEKRVATRYYHYLRTRETIEEEIANSGLTQDEFQKNILDRSRGIKVEKRSIA